MNSLSHSFSLLQQSLNTKALSINTIGCSNDIVTNILPVLYPEHTFYNASNSSVNADATIKFDIDYTVESVSNNNPQFIIVNYGKNMFKLIDTSIIDIDKLTLSSEKYANMFSNM